MVGDPGAASHWVRPLLPILHQTFQEMGTAEDTPRARALSFWFTQGGFSELHYPNIIPNINLFEKSCTVHTYVGRLIF